MSNGSNLMHSISDNLFDIPPWSRIDNPYSYVKNTGPGLLITVGDSWTYGDSLGRTRVRDGIDDTEYRLTTVYGSVLAGLLGNYSWANLALPGGSNEWMLDSLEELLPYADHVNTVCVITLTESGRHEELSLVDQSLPTQQLALTHLLAHTYQRIERLQYRYPKIKLVVGHNFTDGAEGIIDLCDQTWLEVMLGQSIQKNTHVVVSDYIEYMNSDRRYPDVLDVIARAEQRLNLLDSCQYCNKQDTRHPTEAGHRLWAEYLWNKQLQSPTMK
jgi:lysophospholipase L1-like esterase